MVDGAGDWWTWFTYAFSASCLSLALVFHPCSKAQIPRRCTCIHAYNTHILHTPTQVGFSTLLRTALFGLVGDDEQKETDEDAGDEATAALRRYVPLSMRDGGTMDAWMVMIFSLQRCPLQHTNEGRSLRLAGGRGPLFLQYCLTWAVKELAGLLKVGRKWMVTRHLLLILMLPSCLVYV